MSTKFFTPADFTDFENTSEVVEGKSKVHFEKPTPQKMEEMQSRISSEFKKCESGTSTLTHYAIQASTTGPAKNAMSLLFNDFTPKTMINFIHLLKQDYGFRFAEWAATEVFSPYYSEITHEVTRDVKLDQTDKA